MLIGNLLAYTVMEQGLEVTFMPIYGVEMRGGTTSCIVVISDQEIGSPIIYSPQNLILMNQASMDKFHSRLKPGGVEIINSSMVNENGHDRQGCDSYWVPVNDLSNKLGNIKVANMVTLGAWLRATGVVPLNKVKENLSKIINLKNEALLQLNHKALQAGFDYL